MLTHANRQQRSSSRAGENARPPSTLRRSAARPSMQFQSTVSNQAMQRVLQTASATAAGPPVVQRQATDSNATAGKTHQLRDSYESCNELPHVEADVRRAVRTAFERIRDTDCIENQAIKED